MVVSSEPLSEIKRGQIEMLAVTGGAPFLAARVQLQRPERQQRDGNSLKTHQKVRTAQEGLSSCTEMVLQQLTRHARTAKRSANHTGLHELRVGLWVESDQPLNNRPGFVVSARAQSRPRRLTTHGSQTFGCRPHRANWGISTTRCQ